MSDVLAAYDRWEHDDSEGYDSLMAIAGAMANELERLQARLAQAERERDEAQTDHALLLDHYRQLLLDVDEARKERDEARALLEKLRSGAQLQSDSLDAALAQRDEAERERDEARKEHADWLAAEAKYAAERESRRCGTCADWGEIPPDGGWCSSRTSACGHTGVLWPADHGCPHWRAR